MAKRRTPAKKVELARAKKAPPPAARKLSEREELCENCPSPLYACPATVRRMVRCCAHCSHWTKVDVAWEDMLAAQERQAKRFRRRRA